MLQLRSGTLDPGSRQRASPASTTICGWKQRGRQGGEPCERLFRVFLASERNQHAPSGSGKWAPALLAPTPQLTQPAAPPTPHMLPMQGWLARTCGTQLSMQKLEPGLRASERHMMAASSGLTASSTGLG